MVLQISLCPYLIVFREPLNISRGGVTIPGDIQRPSGHGLWQTALDSPA